MFWCDIHDWVPKITKFGLVLTPAVQRSWRYLLHNSIYSCVTISCTEQLLEPYRWVVFKAILRTCNDQTVICHCVCWGEASDCQCQWCGCSVQLSKMARHLIIHFRIQNTCSVMYVLRLSRRSDLNVKCNWAKTMGDRCSQTNYFSYKIQYTGTAHSHRHSHRHSHSRHSTQTQTQAQPSARHSHSPVPGTAAAQCQAQPQPSARHRHSHRHRHSFTV